MLQNGVIKWYICNMKHKKPLNVSIRYDVSKDAAQVITYMQGVFAVKGEEKTKAETLEFILLDYKQKITIENQKK